MDYATMNEFVRIVRLIENRVKVINQLLGCAVVGAIDNHMRMHVRRGHYRVDLCGCEVGEFRSYDNVGASNLLTKLDGMQECLWLTTSYRVLYLA